MIQFQRRIQQAYVEYTRKDHSYFLELINKLFSTNEENRIGALYQVRRMRLTQFYIDDILSHKRAMKLISAGFIPTKYRELIEESYTSELLEAFYRELPTLIRQYNHLLKLPKNYKIDEITVMHIVSRLLKSIGYSLTIKYRKRLVEINGKKKVVKEPYVNICKGRK